MKSLLLSCLLFTLVPTRLSAQTDEATQLLLNWEKLQTLEELLANMYAGYKILDQGYTTIKNIAEGNYSLHRLFFDGLMAVNPSVRNYKRIPFIIEYQRLLVEEYRRANNRFRQDPNFSFDELQYLASVYNFLFQASVKNLDDLITIITATRLRMSDEERRIAIDRLFYDMEGKLIFLRGFNSQTQMLAIQRARAAGDVKTLQALYGLN